VDKSIGLAEVMAAADRSWEASGRRLTFEYVLLGKLNDQPEHAQSLVRLLGGRRDARERDPLQPRGRPALRGADAGRPRAVSRHPARRRRQRARPPPQGGRIDAACGQLRRLATIDASAGS